MTTAKYYDQGKKSKLKCSKVNKALVKVCSGKENGKEKFRKNAVKGYGENKWERKNKQGKCCFKKTELEISYSPFIENKSNVYFFYVQKGKHRLKHAGFQKHCQHKYCQETQAVPCICPAVNSVVLTSTGTKLSAGCWLMLHLNNGH